MQLLPGAQTDVFTYRSKLISGDKNSLAELPGSYLGPIIQVEPGQKIRVRFKNELRTFRFYNEQMRWVINGRTFEMTEVADWEKVKLNTTEIWEFVNGDDGSGMGMMRNYEVVGN